MNENELDFEGLVAEFEEEYQEPEELDETDVEQDEQLDQSNEFDEDYDDEETNAVEEEQDEDPETQIHSEDEQKRNAAFASMRRQMEEQSRYVAFAKQLAEEAGVSFEELQQRFNDNKMQAEADQLDVPLEFYREQQTLKNEVSSLKNERLNERRNVELENVKNAYGAQDADIVNAINYAASQGIDLNNPNVSFEAVYKMANLDTIIEQKVSSSRQESLAQKKQRQASAAIPLGASVTDNSDEITDEYVDEMLAKFDIRI